MLSTGLGNIFMIKKERRRSDNGDESGVNQRRFFNNGTIIKMLTAALLGAGGTGGMQFFSGTEHDTIELNKQEVLRIKEQLSAHNLSEGQQEALFDSKLKSLEVKIDAIDDKIDMLIRQMERSQ